MTPLKIILIILLTAATSVAVTVVATGQKQSPAPAPQVEEEQTESAEVAESKEDPEKHAKCAAIVAQHNAAIDSLDNQYAQLESKYEFDKAAINAKYNVQNFDTVQAVEFIPGQMESQRRQSGTELLSLQAQFEANSNALSNQETQLRNATLGKLSALGCD